MRLKGRLWILVLLTLARARLYRAVRAVLVALHIPADLLVECGDHDGDVTYLDLPWVTHGQVRRPRTTDR